MRLKLLSLTLALAAFSSPGQGTDLLDVYRDARANDPVLSQADAARLSTSEGINQARALLLPQVSAGLSLSQTNGGGGGTTLDPITGLPITNSATGHSRTRSLSGRVQQSVFDFSKYTNLKAARSASEAQNEMYRAAQEDLYVRVASAYFGVLTSQDALTFAKANEDSFRQQFEQSDQRFKVGLSAITDVYQAKAYYEAAKAQTITAQNTLNDAREALSQITGKPTGDLKSLREDLPMNPPAPADQDAWVQQALKTNPSLLAQKRNVETAEHNIRTARAGHLPTIDANLSYGKGATWYESPGLSSRESRPSTTIGLTLNVPIFFGGATQSRVRQSIYQRDSAADSMEQQRRQVVRDTLNYYRSVIAGISQVESAKSSVESGQKALEATRAGFEVGTQTMTNVLLAIQTLMSSESTYSQARHQFILNKLLLKESAGTVDVKDLEEINSLLN